MENTHANIPENMIQIGETDKNMTIINCHENNNKKMDGRKNNIMRDKKKTNDYNY